MAYKKIINILPYKIEELYAMIVDVEKYPLFVPHCQNLVVNDINDNIILATMHIEFFSILKKIDFKYTSKILVDQPNYAVYITDAIGDFFKKFESTWKLKPCVGGVEVFYDILFEIKNPILNMTLSNLLLSNSDAMVEAFKKRAKQLLKPAL